MEGLTGDSVDYRPYQEAAADFPTFRAKPSRTRFQLIEADGQVYSGAAATYRVLRRAGTRRVVVVYAHVPGFASISEWAYGFFSRPGAC